jgi:pimeloyl-ACP methyl ester carboxylesterase
MMIPKKLYCLSVTVLILALALAGCGGTPEVTPTSTPAEAERISGNFDVGGRSLYINCKGAGSPTVVLDAGYGGSTYDWSWVHDDIAEFTRVCAYDRAGNGNSDPATPPRTTMDLAEELHTLLVNARIQGPYILVGHSFAGHIIRLYTSQYPEEVVGVLLVDVRHGNDDARILEILPPETPEDSEELIGLREQITAALEGRSLDDLSMNPEGIDILASDEEARAAGSMGDIPLIVISTEYFPVASGIPADIAFDLNQLWVELQNSLVDLSSNGTQVIATGSSHMVQIDKPELVIDAVNSLVGMATSD